MTSQDSTPIDADQLQEALRAELRRRYPDAADDSEQSLLEFNRLLDERMGFADASDADLEDDNRFEPAGDESFRSDSQAKLEHHAWRWGRYVYLRATITVGAMDLGVGKIKPDDLMETLTRGMRWTADQLDTWGTCRFFHLRAKVEGEELRLRGLFLTDPLTLGLIVPDERGRPAIRGARFRVPQVVQVAKFLGLEPGRGDFDMAQFRDAVYGQLSPQQVHAAFAYWHVHREEVERILHEERELVEAHRRAQPVIAQGTK